MAVPPSRFIRTSSFGWWLAVVVAMISAILLVMVLIGLTATTPGWLPWLLFLLLGVAILAG